MAAHGKDDNMCTIHFEFEGKERQLVVDCAIARHLNSPDLNPATQTLLLEHLVKRSLKTSTSSNVCTSRAVISSSHKAVPLQTHQAEAGTSNQAGASHHAFVSEASRPTSQASTSLASTSQAFTSQASTSQASASQASTSQATSQASTSQASTSQASASQASTSQASTSQATSQASASNDFSTTVMSRAAVLTLIDIHQTKAEQFASKTLKKKAIWEQIASEMAEKGVGKFNHAQVKNKWHNLTMLYRKTVDHNNRTGNSPRVCPYFNELDSYLSSNPNVTPEILLSSDNGALLDAKKETDTDPFNSGLLKGPPTKKQRLPERTEKILSSLRAHEEARSDDTKKVLAELKDQHNQLMKVENEKVELERQKLEVFKKLLEKM